MYQSSSRPTTRDDAMMATMMLISSTPEAYRTYNFYRATLVLCFHQNMLQSINQYLYYKLTTVIIHIMLQKTGLLNVTQGSYKVYVGSPAGSHFSKLVATPV